MSEAKFTNGPWVIHDSKLSNQFRIGQKVVFSPVAHTSRLRKGKHDAHLIAAAPEMYEMLESLLKPYGREDLSDENIKMLLAKARGE